MHMINGITYFQLVNCSTEELNAIVAAETGKELRKNISFDGVAEEITTAFTALAIPIIERHLRELYMKTFTDDFYCNFRRVYDVEWRFNLAARLETMKELAVDGSKDVGEKSFQEAWEELKKKHPEFMDLI